MERNAVERPAGPPGPLLLDLYPVGIARTDFVQARMWRPRALGARAHRDHVGREEAVERRIRHHEVRHGSRGRA